MRIHLKCSCGAEATLEITENEGMYCGEDIFEQADLWRVDHAKCREAEPAKECKHMYPSNQGVPRCVHCGKEIGT